MFKDNRIERDETNLDTIRGPSLEWHKSGIVLMILKRLLQDHGGCPVIKDDRG